MVPKSHPRLKWRPSWKLPGRRFLLFSLLVVLWTHPHATVSGENTVTETVTETIEPPPHSVFTNGSGSMDGSLAEILDTILENEFPESENGEGEKSSFNTSVAEQQAVLETVARVTHDKPRSNNTAGNNSEPEEQHENGSQEVPMLIDSKDNMFVMMNPKTGNMVLQQDLRLISDLVIVIASAAVGGIVFACMGQPVLTGYLLAGSIVGPGGLDIVSELVQVETLAQFGVLFLLFSLGMEFSAKKLRAVRGVAILGGLLQTFLFITFGGFTAIVCGGRLREGVFVGALLSMSSTAVVLKCLLERGLVQSNSGQVTVGTLILQDCTVGLLFSLLPLLGGSSSILEGFTAMFRELVILAIFLAVTSVAGHYGMTRMLHILKRISAQTSELYQLGVVAFCLSVAWVSDWLTLSIELGAFVAGVMISTTDLAEHTMQQVDPIRNLFGALFMVSIGMIMNPAFLWKHLDILLASVILVVVSKTIVVALVVRCFGYSSRTAVTVGLSLAQIGEFAFVLLGRASNLHLLQKRVYLLLLGTTALSLVSTPILFRFIPHIHRIGADMGWFRPENETLIELKQLPSETKMDTQDEDFEFPLESWKSIFDIDPLKQWLHIKVGRWFPKP